VEAIERLGVGIHHNHLIFICEESVCQFGTKSSTANNNEIHIQNSLVNNMPGVIILDFMNVMGDVGV
jgi:hypothetical protein